MSGSAPKPPENDHRSFCEELAVYIRACYPILSIVSAEEDRVLEQVESVLKNPGLMKNERPLFVWTISRGFVAPDGREVSGAGSMRPETALAFLRKFDRPAVFLFKDLHPYIRPGAENANLVVRMLRDSIPHLKKTSKTILWSSPVMQIPFELEKEVTVIDFPLPDEAEYHAIVEELARSLSNNPRVIVDLDEEGKDRLVKACQGLTRCEAENALYRTVVRHGRLDSRDVDAILSEKEQIVRKSGILKYFSSVENFGTLGGLGNLKQWLRRRNNAFSKKAREFGLPNPRGVLLVGVPGCGKSLCAKTVAAEWKKPLLRFDMGSVYDSKLGESESRMRKALDLAEAVAPSILWIDELEKALGGGGRGDRERDGGVSERIFGYLLTWMEEKKKPVFVAATANDISRLPPELLRKGRFDEIFFIDLPSAQERAEILAIHLAKKNRDVTRFDIAAIVEKTENFAGAELEELVNSALFEAFSDPEKDLKTEHLLKAASEIVTLYQSRRADIDALRQWARTNCRPAAAPPDKPARETDALSEARRRLIDI